MNEEDLKEDELDTEESHSCDSCSDCPGCNHHHDDDSTDDQDAYLGCSCSH